MSVFLRKIALVEFVNCHFKKIQDNVCWLILYHHLRICTSLQDSLNTIYRILPIDFILQICYNKSTNLECKCDNTCYLFGYII